MCAGLNAGPKRVSAGRGVAYRITVISGDNTRSCARSFVSSLSVALLMVWSQR